MTELTARQAELLAWLRNCTAERLPAPGDSQIAKRFGLRTGDDGMRLLNDLADTGEIEIERTSLGRIVHLVARPVAERTVSVPAEQRAVIAALPPSPRKEPPAKPAWNVRIGPADPIPDPMIAARRRAQDRARAVELLFSHLVERAEVDEPCPDDAEIARRFDVAPAMALRRLEQLGRIAIETGDDGRRIRIVETDRRTAPIAAPTAPVPPPEVEEPIVMTDTAPLSDRARDALAWLRDLAARGEDAPTNQQVREHLGLPGHDLAYAAGTVLKPLEKAGLIRIEHKGGRRAIALVDTGQTLAAPSRQATARSAPPVDPAPSVASPEPQRTITPPAAAPATSIAASPVVTSPPPLKSAARVTVIDGRPRLIFGMAAGEMLQEMMSTPLTEEATIDLLTSAAIALAQVRSGEARL